MRKNIAFVVLFIFEVIIFVLGHSLAEMVINQYFIGGIIGAILMALTIITYEVFDEED